MKRRYVFAAFCVLWLCCSNLRASHTTAYQAQKVVTGWLKTDASPLETSIGQQVKAVETFTNDTGQPIYYIVYLQPSGFVIVSADDLIEPIIGFTEDGIYDPSPANPLGALVTGDLNGRMELVRTGQPARTKAFTGVSENAQSKWSKFIGLAEAPEKESGIMGLMGLSDIDDVRVTPLIQTRWHQTTCCSSPALACYNYYTPGPSGGSGNGDPANYPCGCVATALAQIMRYHQYPNTGIGTGSFDIKIRGATYSRSTRGGDGSGGAYSWADMVLVPGCSTTLAQRQAIGALCYDAGVADSNRASDVYNPVQYTNYYYNYPGIPITTIAYTHSAKVGLTTTFKYSNAIYGFNNGLSIDDGLIGMVNPDLDAGLPVFFGIKGGGVGHAVVCDGYGYNAGTMYHHINMGWAGTSDAWYDLPDITSSYDTLYETIYNIYKLGTGEVISGRVTDPAGNPISNVNVNEYIDDGGPFHVVVTHHTNSKGIYSFYGLPSDSNFVVWADKTGYTFGGSTIVRTGKSNDLQPISGNVWGVDFVCIPPDINTIAPTSGPPGTYMEIQGTYFGASPGTVVFPGVSCFGEVLLWSDTLILCRVPSCSASGDIIVRSSVGVDSEGVHFDITSPTTIYVDVNYTPDVENGSISYPFSKIERGIYAATTADTVIVNPGTYCENINLNGKNITLTGTDPNDPCTVALTIIDGNQADTVVTFSSGENTDSLLRGFTITNGYSEFNGGGIYCQQSSPTISRCVIRNNISDSGGGGIKCYNCSSAVITYCSITANRAGESQSGGGMSCWNDSNAVISYCNISDNNCGYGGAGMYINSSRPELTDCVFSGNFMTDESTYGGAINIYDSSPKITGCTFINNRASWEAGAVYNNWNCSPILINCTFVNNIAGESGGAISNSSSAMPKLINCSFLGNRAGARGGAIYGYSSNYALTMTNCRFAGNVVTKTGSDGGAIYNDGCGPAITGCTFSDNFAKDKGGAIYNAYNDYGTNGNMSAANCIFWGNLGTGQIYDYLSTTLVTYSDVQSGWTGTGNINSDPLFIASGFWVDVNDANIIVEPNDPNALWLDGDYHLEYNSDCIDAGSNSSVPADTYDIDGDANTSEPIPQDLDGRPRIKDGDCNTTQIVDMGAYEFNWTYLGDFEGDCDVDFTDFAVFALSWPAEQGQPAYNPLCDIAIPADNRIDFRDLKVFCDNWLTGIE